MSGSAEALYRLIKSRRSIRRFLPERISPEIIKRLIEAAGRAPSAHNRQPWRYVILGQTAERARLVEQMRARWVQDLTADGLPADQIEQTVARGAERLQNAPVIILVCLTMSQMDEYRDARRKDSERVMAVQSVAMAGSFLLLSAHAEGLGACWMCAPLFVPELVRDVLELPSDWEPQGAIALGYPADEGRDRSRRAFEEVARWQ